MHLHIVSIQNQGQTGKDLPSYGQPASWQNQDARLTHAAPARCDQRAAKVEALRAQVRAGLYTVDSRAVAERLLQSETHFL